jgi:pre-mRNA-splicing factor CWC26
MNFRAKRKQIQIRCTHNTMSLKAYLAEKYMSGPKADAILSRVAPKKKKKRKLVGSSSGGDSSLVRDEDGGLGDEGKEEDDLSEAVVASDRSFKKRNAEEGSGWITIQPAERPPTPPDELVETVYRDASGRKIDSKAERAEAARKKREREEKEAQRMEWGKGLVQRDEDERRRQELERAKTSHFSRHADDKQLNEDLRARQRWDDPAAAFLSVRSFFFFFTSTIGSLRCLFRIRERKVLEDLNTRAQGLRRTDSVSSRGTDGTVLVSHPEFVGNN